MKVAVDYFDNGMTKFIVNKKDRRMKNGRPFAFYNNRKVEGTKISQNARQKRASLFNLTRPNS